MVEERAICAPPASSPHVHERDSRRRSRSAIQEPPYTALARMNGMDAGYFLR